MCAEGIFFSKSISVTPRLLEMRVADMFCKIVFFTNQWLKCGNNKINVSVTQTENPALHCIGIFSENSIQKKFKISPS